MQSMFRNTNIQFLVKTNVKREWNSSTAITLSIASRRVIIAGTDTVIFFKFIS